MVKLIDWRALRGANYYSYRPVIVLQVDLQDYDEVFTDKIEGFTDALLELVPSLEEHRCSEDVRGGLIHRMREGTAAVGLSSATNSTTSFDTWSVTPGGSATQTFVFLGADSGQIGGSGSTRPNVRVPTTATTAVYSSGVVSGVSGDGASALTDPQLGSNNLAHSHSTTSQAGTTGTTTSQTGTTFTSGAASNATTSAPSTSTFTSGAASNATTTSGGSASLDIKPAY